MICMCVFFRLSGVIPLTMRWLCSSQRDQEDLTAQGRRSGQKNIEFSDTVVLGSHHNALCRDSGSVEDNHDGDKPYENRHFALIDDEKARKRTEISIPSIVSGRAIIPVSKFQRTT
jgi:hypothetical protein